MGEVKKNLMLLSEFEGSPVTFEDAYFADGGEYVIAGDNSIADILRFCIKQSDIKEVRSILDVIIDGN